MSDTAALIAEAQWKAAKRGVLSMWTVYDARLTPDRPDTDKYLVRRFDCSAEGPIATNEAYAGELELIRDTLHRAGLIRMNRQHGDEPQIVETWL